MVLDAGDDGECVANKSNVRWTLTGGSFMNGESLPGCATPPTKSVQLALLKDPLLSTIIDSHTHRQRQTLPVLFPSIWWLFIRTSSTLAQRCCWPMLAQEGCKGSIWSVWWIRRSHHHTNGSRSRWHWLWLTIARATHKSYLAGGWCRQLLSLQMWGQAGEVWSPCGGYVRPATPSYCCWHATAYQTAMGNCVPSRY